MSYTPTLVPRTLDNVWLQTELRRIAEAMSQGDVVLRLIETSSEPSKVTEGEIRIADGVNWDPGAGAGTYIFRGGIWQLLEAGFNRTARSMSFFLGG